MGRTLSPWLLKINIQQLDTKVSRSRPVPLLRQPERKRGAIVAGGLVHVSHAAAHATHSAHAAAAHARRGFFLIFRLFGNDALGR